MPRTLVLALLLASATSAMAQDFDLAGEQAMLGRINTLRQERHLGPLTRSQDLDGAARIHSQDMALHGQLTHVSEATGTPSDRVRAAGVTARTVTENVALHRSVDEAYQALLQSDPHRANMLNPDVTQVGIAAFRNERGVWITQLFAQQTAAPQQPVAQLPQIPRPVAPVAQPPVVQPPPVAQLPAPQAPQTTLEPQPGSDGSVLFERDQTGRIQAYWVMGSGRWWYYPLPANPQPGQQLAPDLSVQGPPPGYGPQPQPQQAPAPMAQAPAPQPAPQQPFTIDPFSGATVQLPDGQFYQVPPPPFLGTPGRAWQRAQERWQRAYQQWQQQQEALRRRAL